MELSKVRQSEHSRDITLILLLYNPFPLMEHLPRAERLLKDYLDVQINELITRSDEVSRKYLASREEFIAKSKCIPKVKMEISRLLSIMENSLSLSLASRQMISDVQGMSQYEIQTKIKELRQVLDSFEEGKTEVEEKMDEGGLEQSPQELQIASAADLNEAKPIQTLELMPNSPPQTSIKHLGVMLLFLEGLSCLSAILAITYNLSHLL